MVVFTFLLQELLLYQIKYDNIYKYTINNKTVIEKFTIK